VKWPPDLKELAAVACAHAASAMSDPDRPTDGRAKSQAVAALAMDERGGHPHHAAVHGSESGPTLTTWSLPQVVSYLRYTGRAPTLEARRHGSDLVAAVAPAFNLCLSGTGFRATSFALV